MKMSNLPFLVFNFLKQSIAYIYSSLTKKEYPSCNNSSLFRPKPEFDALQLFGNFISWSSLND